MKIFVVNLKQAVDRKKHMEKQLGAMNLSYEFIEAVDGRELDDEALVERSNLGFYRQHPSWDTRGKGIIGCALSHQNIYKKIVKRKIPRVLILEDDIHITKDMPMLLRKINKMRNIEKNELILFDAMSIGEKVRLSSFNRRGIGKTFSLLYPINFNNLWNGSAYSISYESAAAFLDAYPKVERVPDAWGAFYEKNIFSTISCVNRPAAYQGAFDSSIGVPASNMRFKSKARLMVRQRIPSLYLLVNKIKSAKKNSFGTRYNIQNEFSKIDPNYDIDLNISK